MTRLPARCCSGRGPGDGSNTRPRRTRHHPLPPSDAQGVPRSGAGTVSELTALGKPSVLIPLATSAGNEQEHNALHLQGAGAAVALTGDRATASALRGALEPLLSDPQRRETMAGAARSMGKPDAAQRLVELLLSVALNQSR